MNKENIEITFDILPLTEYRKEYFVEYVPITHQSMCGPWCLGEGKDKDETQAKIKSVECLMESLKILLGKCGEELNDLYESVALGEQADDLRDYLDCGVNNDS